MLHVVATCGVIVLLAIAAWRDLATRTIPNWSSLGIVLLGLTSRIAAGPTAVLASLCTASIVFLVLAALHAKNALGGGDVKLAAAMAVALPPVEALQFIEATAILGGIVAVIYLLAARLEYRPRGRRHRLLPLRVLAVEANRIRRRASLPYGIPLALAGALVLTGV